MRAARASAAIALLCLTTSQLTAQRESGPGGLVRRMDGIPVRDSSGQALAAPWLGGFNLPRPQLVDLDNSGRVDLFVQETRNQLMHFTRDDGDWRLQDDQFQELPVGEWFRFADLNGDGRIDLLAESPTGYIRAWRNDSTADGTRFTPVVDSLRDVHGQPIFADPQNILTVVDIDCNGRLDLFIGRVAGYIDRYEQVGRDAHGFPIFDLFEERWQDIEVLGPIPGQTTPFEGAPTMRHGANTMAFGDIDGDGDLDLFWGDFFEAGLLLIRNDGTSCARPSLRGPHERFPLGAELLTSGYNAPSLGDIDGDGRLDLVMGVIGGAYQPARTAIDNLYLLTQPAADSFHLVTRRLITMIDVGSESVPALADLDGDGDTDLLLANKIAPGEDSTATITWFENIGTATAPVLADRGLLPIRGSFHWAPAVVDLDGDGLLDLVLGTWTDRVQWWRNVGTRSAPSWQLADTALVTLTRGSNTTPTLADLDGDGLLDMIVGEASGQLNLYRNVGTAQAPSFDLVSDNFGDIDVGRRSAPLLADLEGRGRADLLVGAEDGTVRLWRRVGDPGEIRFVADPDFLLVGDQNATPALGSLFGAGSIDLLLGGSGGGLRWFHRAL
ncbi:MAG: VCBS repeat-containing protein [Gemmatimonadales bacterium]|nr:VCBS repeat-containing protein [Gemmatimonadales bacterium]MDZ4389495.1 VCBS repeat-containing protein [Gemmatimonadales bacterium]